MAKKLLFVLIFAAACVFAFAAKPIAVLDADFSAPKTEVSPSLYGIFFEDINYGADGGLYGELIQNRSFESSYATEGWDKIKAKGGKTTLKAKNADSLNENNPHYGELKIDMVGSGAGNKGFGGIPLEQGKSYKGSLYIKSKDGSINSAVIALDDGKAKEKFAETKISGITTEWKKFDFELKPSKNFATGRLVILPEQTGIVHIDMVSMFRPETFKNQPNGMRNDLATMLNDLNPGFMRFPGGCVVEGKGLANAYRWKDTIGDIAERKENANCWGYQQSYGIGFYEYFRFCEDMGCEPVPVINCGMSCQARGVEYALMSDLDDWIQDAKDLIEFANGSAETEWGKVRAQMGHPEPFNMKYLAVGNENWDQGYYERYEEFGWELRESNPEIKLIFAAGPIAEGTIFENAWNQVEVMREYIDLVDEHYYKSPEWFLSNTHRYDSYNRNGPKVFLGEYAAHNDNRANNLWAAIAEAAYMTHLERNGDIVELASYAPLLAKIGANQWAPDMIWFDNQKAYGTPSYYVQKMFGNNKSDRTVSHTLTIDEKQVKKQTIGGSIGVGTWLTSAEFSDLQVTSLDGKQLWSIKQVSNLAGFDQQRGQWSQSGSTIINKSLDDNCRCVLSGPNWSTYNFELKAKKTGGAEAFLIMIGYKNGKFYWWNIGGWGNTLSCIEKGTAAARTIVTEQKPCTITADKEYDIKVEVGADTIRCYLDGELIHELFDPQSFDPIFAHIGETDNNEIIVKLVNTTPQVREVQINLNNVEVLPEGKELVLSDPSALAENTMQRPTAVAPKEGIVKNAASKFSYKAKANSISILTLKKK